MQCPHCSWFVDEHARQCPNCLALLGATKSINRPNLVITIIDPPVEVTALAPQSGRRTRLLVGALVCATILAALSGGMLLHQPPRVRSVASSPAIVGDIPPATSAATSAPTMRVPTPHPSSTPTITPQPQAVPPPIATATALATATATATPAGSGNQANFVKVDTSTQGSWLGVYGRGGYQLAEDAQALPSPVQVTITNQSNYVWAATTTDGRALQRPPAPDNRLAATWYTPTSYTIDVTISDGKTHQLALYCLDWDGNNTRQETLALRDVNGVVLDQRAVANFSMGQYDIWSIRGHIIIYVTNTGPLNAVVSGLFFD